MKFHENPFRESRFVPCGRTDGWTDRHDKANSRFRNFTTAAKNYNKVFLKNSTGIFLKQGVLKFKDFFLPYRITLRLHYRNYRRDNFFINICWLFGQPYETHKCAYNLQEERRKSINIKAGAADSYYCTLTDQNFMAVKSDLRYAESCQHQTTHASLNSWMPQAKRSIRTVPTSVKTIHFKDVH
jgi:hypothetical protein